jgi:hypothetical protein
MMRTFGALLLGLGALAATGPATAADLGKIDRRIAKEPAYRSKAPRYCLLVFGLEAKTRVWLVQDGDILYVDRNGNGDLTEEGEKVLAEKEEGAEEGVYAFMVGEIRDGPRLHKRVRVGVMKVDHVAQKDPFVKALLAKNPKARGYVVLAEVDMPGWKGTGVGGRVPQEAYFTDANGALQFAERPQDAPILHFGGPWQVGLLGGQQLKIGRQMDVVLGVGTAGVGPGATTWIGYDGVIPADAHPTLEITFPAKQPGDPPRRERYELKQQC